MVQECRGGRRTVGNGRRCGNGSDRRGAERSDNTVFNLTALWGALFLVESVIIAKNLVKNQEDATAASYTKMPKITW